MTFPTARPTLLALRLETEDRVLVVLEVFFFTEVNFFVVVAFGALLDEAGFFLVFRSITCAAGSMSLLSVRFLGEEVFLRGCVFLAKTFRMLSS
mgnify:CR=1 FL=1